MRLIAALTTLRRDQRGAAAVEFGLCAAAFISLLLACTQVALVFFAQQGIQSASEELARKVLTGQITTGMMTQAQFKTEACKSLPSYMSCSKLMIDVRTVSDFSNVTTAPTQLTYNGLGQITNAWSYDVGGGNDIVVLRLMYLWNTPLGPLGFSLSNQGNASRLLTGTMVFKAEPYGS